MRIWEYLVFQKNESLKDGFVWSSKGWSRSSVCTRVQAKFTLKGVEEQSAMTKTFLRAKMKRSEFIRQDTLFWSRGWWCQKATNERAESKKCKRRRPEEDGPVSAQKGPILSYGPPWAHYLGGYQDRLLGGPLGLLDLCRTEPDGVRRKDYGGEVLG
jgi:hypothetical protein